MSITYLEAIREAQAKALALDDRVFIYGQDVGVFGGAFKATKGLAREFPGRVLDSPISEDAAIGLAVGASYAHYPGLIVMNPATVEDAYQMLLEAVSIDDPVIFCEHKFLYYHLKADSLPDSIRPALPIGKARVARAGRDASVVTYSAMVHEALSAAEKLAGEGIEIEVVDLRTVKPLDLDTILGSVARTGRLLCVCEEAPWGGTTAEVVARVAQEGFTLLDAPPQRLNARDTPVPYHPALWQAHRPGAQAIVKAVRELLKF